MKLKIQLLAGAAVVAGAVTSVPTYAQESQMMETVVVTGMRASLESAMNLKKNSTAIVDSIVAEDIGKFPDLNVTDALQHITGVQVTRDLGEGGSAVQIRGLQQVQTTLNGQEIMTAGGGRVLNLQDLPAELVSGVDVYKTATSDQLEGGLGGLVNVRTARPFDFTETQFTADVRFAYADLAKSVKPQASALYSDRWTTSIGEVGILLNASVQKRAFHQSFDSAGTPSINTVGLPGTNVWTTTGFWNPTQTGHRDRFGLNGSIQWRPSSSLDFYFDANFLRFSTYANQYVYYNYPSASQAVPGSFTVFPGTSDFASGRYAGNLTIGTQGVARDTNDITQNYVLGGNYNNGALTVNGSVQYVRGRSNLYYTAITTSTPATSLYQDNTTVVPSYTFGGANLDSLNAYTLSANGLSHNMNQYYATQLASQLNAQYELNWGPIKEIDAGIRYVVRDNDFWGYRHTATFGAKAATDISNWMIRSTNLGFGGVLSGYSLPSSIWTFNPDMMRSNLQGLRTALGDTKTLVVDAKSPYTQSERVTSGYLQAKIDTELLVPITGTIGGRVMNSNESIVGMKTVSGALVPFVVHNSRTDFLPAANFTAHITDELKVRAAFSKTLNLPGFSDLAPGLTLVPGNHSGNGGNPDLKPMTATSYDISIEYYFNKGDSVYVALFDKEVKNFWQSRTYSTIIDGEEWALTGKTNVDPGYARGLEVGYTQWYDFLPGLLSGLGTQANYTYVDSHAPSSVVGFNTPLQNLSRHSFNLIGMYEKGPFSARIAYNWRSSFYTSLYSAAGEYKGTSTNYNKAYGWLDASVSYEVNDNVTVSLEGSNLLHTRLDTYATYTTRPTSTTINDRQFMVALRYKM